MIVGHDLQQRYFQQLISNNRLHQAYVLEGPKGVGKATFSRELAQRMLGGKHAASLVASGAHPDYRELRIEEDPKTGKFRREITKAQVEDMLGFMTKHASISERKVILIDSADDLNVSSSNSLLKWLEEPRPNSYLLLVAHRPDRLLPTILSRCVRIRFHPLSRTAFSKFADHQGFQDETHLFELAGGIPGQALELLDPNIQKLNAVVSQMVERGFQADQLKLCRDASSMLPSKDLSSLILALRLLRRNLRMWARKRKEPAEANLEARAYSLIQNREAQAAALNLDPGQVWAAVLLDLSDLASEGRAYG